MPQSTLNITLNFEENEENVKTSFLENLTFFTPFEEYSEDLKL